MRTTVTLDGRTVAEVMKMTAAKTKTKAVAMALDEFIRRTKIDILRSMLGKVELDVRAIEELREADRRETEEIDG
jgi:Arc/MetJ family transcription regulator